MPLMPIAGFLAGSLLTILVPLCLLIAIVGWYTKFVRRIPDPVAPSGTEAPLTTDTEGDKPHHA